ncbi:mesaconyl-C(4)-CoA hydratase [soil metagenome]
MSVSDTDIAHWQEWVGRIEIRSELLDRETARRFAAAIGESLDVDRLLPSLAHWAFFLPTVASDLIEVDGHPRRGGFMPPITLPRRMFAASEMVFHAPLILGWEADRTSTILDVTHKSGRSGDLVLVKVGHRIAQAGMDRVSETQTIVYRDAGEATPAVQAGTVAPSEKDVQWSPGPVDLFRFSAVTFNSHRIHYDLPYVTGVEGYPALVVHGPLTATKLYGYARHAGQTPKTYGFRAIAPLFCDQPIVLRDDGAGHIRAIRCDGADAMTAVVKR